ncbi:MAG: sigma-54 dependent transcriptional regulator [Gammaproteobacteria bacterium]|nr:sigma-54 dependent transcriptional regulator [Gammaproteobacteria bacterium]
MANILIIEDDKVFSELLVMHLEEQDHNAYIAYSLEQAREIIHTKAIDAILLDNQLPDGLGIDLLKEIAEPSFQVPVIMITGVSDNTLAIEAMRSGAYDFIRKPMDKVELDITLNNALKTHRLSRQITAIIEGDDYQINVGQIVGNSPAILDICKTIGSVASSNAPVLITGESGTGKEVVARALHNHSGRSGLFLPINCSALAENLLESELFGHDKGSFTGAIAHKAGKFELAVDGTLFLDEVGEMSTALQAKLLRVLQEGSFERVGGIQTLHTNTRIIAATNRNLKEMIQEGNFREDLYYRLNVVHTHIPPLRDRMDDLPLLTEHLLVKINNKQHTKVKYLAENAWQHMKAYQWPGNIRELENILTRASVLARTDTITADLLALPQDTDIALDKTQINVNSNTVSLISLDDLEQEHIKSILEHTHWHKGKTCEILGISRPALDRKIAKYNLS